MEIEIRKAVTDAGYVAVGVGVLAFQQAQVRRRELQKRLGETGGCLNARAVDGKNRLDSLQQTVGTLQQTVGEKAQELRARIEPVVGQVVDQVGDRVKTVVNRAA